MTYDELTNEQKDMVAGVDTWRRGILSSLVQVLRASNAAVNLPRAVEVDALVAMLDDGEIVPNSTGLGGARSLSRDRFLAVGTLLSSILGVHVQSQQTDPTLIVDAIGTANV